MKEGKRTAENKKKLNLSSQNTDKEKNGRIPDEYPLFGLARNHCFGIPKNLAALSALLDFKNPVVFLLLGYQQICLMLDGLGCF